MLKRCWLVATSDDGKCTHSCVSNFAVTGHSSGICFLPIRVRGLSLFPVRFLHLIGNSFFLCLVFVFAGSLYSCMFSFPLAALARLLFLPALLHCVRCGFVFFCLFPLSAFSALSCFLGGGPGEVPGKISCGTFLQFPFRVFVYYCGLICWQFWRNPSGRLLGLVVRIHFHFASLIGSWWATRRTPTTPTRRLRRRRRPRRRRAHQSCRTGIVSILGHPEVTVQFPRRVAAQVWASTTPRTSCENHKAEYSVPALRTLELPPVPHTCFLKKSRRRDR